MAVKNSALHSKLLLLSLYWISLLAKDFGVVAQLLFDYGSFLRISVCWIIPTVELAIKAL